MEKRYYYKAQNGTELLTMDKEIKNSSYYTQITYEEFCAIQESWNEHEETPDN